MGQNHLVFFFKSCICAIINVQDKIVLCTPEEVAYIMVYVRDFFLHEMGYQAPENSVFETMLKEVVDEVGATLEEHVEFANHNLVVPMKKSPKADKKAELGRPKVI